MENKKLKKKNHTLRDAFIAGILAMLPLMVTIYILKFLYGLITSSGMPLLKKITGEIGDTYIGMMTVLVFVVIVLAVGILAKLYVGKIFLNALDKVVTNIPIARSLYAAVKQMIDSFGSSSNNFEKVVLVNFPHEKNKCVGYVVRHTQTVIENHIGEPCYNVFVPTAPNPTSGFVVIVPIKDCIELPITVEEGLKFVFSVGMINLNEVKKVV